MVDGVEWRVKLMRARPSSTSIPLNGVGPLDVSECGVLECEASDVIQRVSLTLALSVDHTRECGGGGGT